MPCFARIPVFAASVVFAASGASASANHYGLTVSTAATYNVSFNNGVFTATGDNAVLNVNDLENALANGSTEVTTDNGSGGDEKGDLHVEAALSWTSASALTLDAYHSIFVDQPVSDEGGGAVTLQNNDGGIAGMLRFGSSGSIGFQNLSSALTIDGNAYVLVGDLATLAGDVTANPSGHYALANDYDASQDGTYSNAPVATPLAGTFEGLGHLISNLEIDFQSNNFGGAGLFYETTSSGTIRDIGVKNVGLSVKSYNYASVGGVVGLNNGQVINAFATGTAGGDPQVSSPGVGGLVGDNVGTIAGSWADVAVTQNQAYAAGGLAGSNAGTIQQSFATGDVNGQVPGGLAGYFLKGEITDCYARGAVSRPGNRFLVGGLISIQGGHGYSTTVQTSYSTGAVPPPPHKDVGGSIGARNRNDPTTDTYLYWDTTTSGTTVGVGGGSSKGISPLTSRQLRRGLPRGFDPAIWTKDKGINDGFPYLKTNPPPG